MVLDWLGRGGDVGDLIARGKYDKAAGLLEEQIRREGGSTRLQNQLADVLIMAGRGHDAVPLLNRLANELAAEGQAAKAIAMLKKIQKIEPGPQIAQRLASLIKDKSRPHAGGWTPGARYDGYEPAGASFSEDHFSAAASAPTVVTPEQRIAAACAANWQPDAHDAPPPPLAMPIAPLPPVPAPAAVAAPSPAVPELEILEPDDDLGFEDQLQGMIAQAVKPGAAAPAPAPAAHVESPLFSGFSEEELVAVIQGLQLLIYEPGDIILTEGDAGDSLFVLTTGVAKAFIRTEGGQKLVRTMGEGTFFGEISILSGKPRTATVTAATSCELLELDRATLDSITRDHPKVRSVLEEFYIQRAANKG